MGQSKQTQGLMPLLQRLPGLLLPEPGVLSASFCYRSMLLTHTQLLVHQVLQVLFSNTDSCTANPQPVVHQGPDSTPSARDFSWFRVYATEFKVSLFADLSYLLGIKLDTTWTRPACLSIPWELLSSWGSCTWPLPEQHCSCAAAVSVPSLYLPDPDLLAWFPALTLNLPHHRLAVWSQDPGWHRSLFPGI